MTCVRASGTERAVWRHYSSSRKRRVRMAIAQDWCCWWCGGVMIDTKGQGHPLSITIEHLVPRAAGGPTRGFNLVAAHARCNHERGQNRWPVHDHMLVTERYHLLCETKVGDGPMITPWIILQDRPRSREPHLVPAMRRPGKDVHVGPLAPDHIFRPGGGSLGPAATYPENGPP